jgi:hypothetical protein
MDGEVFEAGMDALSEFAENGEELKRERAFIVSIEEPLLARIAELERERDEARRLNDINLGVRALGITLYRAAVARAEAAEARCAVLREALSEGVGHNPEFCQRPERGGALCDAHVLIADTTEAEREMLAVQRAWKRLAMYGGTVTISKNWGK